MKSKPNNPISLIFFMSVVGFLLGGLSTYVFFNKYEEPVEDVRLKVDIVTLLLIGILCITIILLGVQIIG